MLTLFCSPIPGGDFRAWDKFDVDRALDKVDAVEVGHRPFSALRRRASRPSDTGGPGDRSAPPGQAAGAHGCVGCGVRRRHWTHRRFAAGNVEKEAGNEQFKQGKYAAAIECYSRGVTVDPLNPALFANRAMARLKMKQ